MLECRKHQKVPSLRLHSMAATALNIASQNDIQFLKNITTSSATQEYSGYNTKLPHESRRTLPNALKTMYLPLINKSSRYDDLNGIEWYIAKLYMRKLNFDPMEPVRHYGFWLISGIA